MLFLTQLNPWGENILFPKAAFAYIPIPDINVKIAQGKDFVVTATSFYQITDKKHTRLFSQPLLIKVTPSGININEEIWGEQVKIEPVGDSFCQINEKGYRGYILVRKNGNNLEIINILSLEKYLYGVIKLEISPKWDLSTLCAQAIAARTYAFRKLWKEALPITNLSQHQAYGGIEAEDPWCTIAVDLTKGEILTYQGEPINALFHACSGGNITSSEQVWGQNYPYLRGHEDSFSNSSPYQKWTVRISRDKLEKMLQMANFQLKQIKALNIIKKDASGRAKSILIVSNDDSQSLSGEKLREIIGFNILRSTLFKVKKEKNEFIFQGQGWGHGVGMSQWGAEKMGKMGYTTEEILQFYYPKTKISRAY